MPWSKNRKFSKLIYFLVASALLILLGTSAFETLRVAFNRTVNDFFYPYLSIPSDFKYYVSDQSLLWHDKRTLAAKLELQLEENRKLAAKIAVRTELQMDNEELRRMLKLEPKQGYNFIFAEVMLRNPQAWQESFTINKGSNDGIVKGAVVLAPGRERNKEAVVVGIVRNVSRHSAEISTTLNPETHIAAILPRSGSFGFINGGENAMSEGLANITYLSCTKIYTPGEAVVTAGARGEVPPGLYLGQLVEIERIPSIFSSKLYLSAKVKPAADMDNIRYVVIAVKKD
jgi:rod shape-determining protein MreC